MRKGKIEHVERALPDGVVPLTLPDIPARLFLVWEASCTGR